MRRLSLSILLVFLACVSYSQNRDLIKKLKKDLVNADDPARFNILNDLAWEYRAAYPDSGIYYANEALAQAKTGKKKNLAKTLNFIGLCHYHKSDHLAAYEYYQQALKVANSDHDNLQIGHASNNIGRLFLEQGLSEKGKEYLMQARDIFEKLNDQSALAYSLQSLASYYSLSGAKNLAEANYLEAYRIRTTAGNQKEIISALLQLGKFYLSVHKIDDGLKYFHRADSAGLILQDPLVSAETHIQIAEALMIKGDISQAEKMASEGLLQIRKSRNGRLLPEAYLTMGQIQHEKGDIIKAKEYFNLTLGVSSSRNDLKKRLEAYFFLWRADKLNQRLTSGYENYTNYMTLKDSLRTLETTQREAQHNFQMEISRRDAENEILTAEEQRKTAIIFVLVVIIMSAIVIVFLLIKTKNRVLRVNHLLEEKNGEIKTINKTLESKNTTLEKHMVTLVDFSKNRSIAVGNLKHAADDIVTITAKKLNVSQVSIWIYVKEEECIRSIAYYNLDDDKFLDSQTISFKDAPAYFDALRNERMIIAEDARTFPSTQEFSNGYFLQNNIHSLLDVTFFLDGNLKGLLCCEQQHKQRKWTAEDRIFASSVADIISLAFRTAQRLEYEKHIKEQKRKIENMNEVLEDRVKERTAELELQNKRLAEYAFINSHLLRAPVSRILGLLNLMDNDSKFNESELKVLLRTSGDELDQVVRKITAALNDGDHLSIEKIKKQ